MTGASLAKRDERLEGAGQRPGLVRVAGGEPGGRVDARHAEEEQVGADPADRLVGCGAGCDDGVLEQPAADDDHLDERGAGR